MSKVSNSLKLLNKFFILDAIDAERELTQLENSSLDKLRLTIKDKKHKLVKAKSKLVEWICKINAVANVNGKGRDDLKYSILEAAEERKLQAQEYMNLLEFGNKKSCFTQLYNNLYSSLNNFRLLLTKYSENIEVVDPQLKNNVELVEAITDFENIWSKGNLFLVDENKFKCFLVTGWYIEQLIEKYSNFRTQIECRDYEIFMAIPTLIIQSAVLEIIKHNLQPNGTFNVENKPKLKIGTNFVNILANFWPNIIEFKSNEYEMSLNLVKLITKYYEVIKNLNDSEQLEMDEAINILESHTINDTLNDLSSEYSNAICKADVEQLLTIKSLSMDLQRSKPSEWNELLDIWISS